MKEELLLKLKQLADLNKDGELNISDLIVLVQLIATYLLNNKTKKDNE